MAKGGQVKQVGGALATAPVQLVSSAQKRARVQFTINAGVGYLSNAPGTAVGVGYVVTPEAPVIIDRETHGSMVDAPWYGSADTGARLFGVMEVMEG